MSEKVLPAFRTLVIWLTPAQRAKRLTIATTAHISVSVLFVPSTFVLNRNRENKKLSAVWDFQSVSDTGTNRPFLWLTSEFRWDLVLSKEYGRQLINTVLLLVHSLSQFNLKKIKIKKNQVKILFITNTRVPFTLI